MNYNLKDKIQVTKDFLNELEAKSWQEIEYLQSQIANIDTAEENIKLIQLFKNLLTSYYVFIGGLENLNSEEVIVKKSESIKEPVIIEPPVEKAVLPEEPIKDDFFDDSLFDESTTKDEEPFEYFVDFDDPIGDPLTDDDLYNN